MDGIDNDGDGHIDCDDVDCQAPGGDCVAAPPLDRTVATTVADSASYLYSGSNPLQKAADPKTFDPNHIAVLHGRVKDTAGAPLAGVNVTIPGHAEYGYTVTLSDGSYALAVNGGSRLLVEFTLDGYLPAQRVKRPTWQSHANIDEIGLVAANGKTTAVSLSPSEAQTAAGNATTDANGTREPLVIFEPGTTANAVLPDGTKQALSKLTVTVTEFPIDPKNRTLPGAAPTTAGPIYGLDFEVAEAKAINASHVEFSEPVSLYVENLFGLPVGTHIPFSIYHRATGQWESSSNGRVIQVLANTDGVVALDGDGDDIADSASSLASLGITDSDLKVLASRYPANTKLWYGKIAHFSDVIGQARAVAPVSAISPSAAGIPMGTPDHPSRLGAVLVEPQSISRGIPITGTPYSLEYQSLRATGYGPAYQLQLPVTGAALPTGLKRVEYRVSVAGKQYEGSVAAAPNLQQTVVWDGMDLNGRAMQSPQRTEVYIGYVYDGTPSGEVTLGSTFVTKLGLWDARSFDLGGFGLDVMHAYDPVTHTIYFGYGEQRSGENIALVTKPTNLDASFSVGTPDSVFVASDGSLIVTDDQQQDATAPGRVLRITPSGQSTVLVGPGASGAAAKLLLGQPQGIVALDDGTLIVADVMEGAIRRIAKGGTMTTLVSGDATDNPLVLHALAHADGLALGPRQELYIVDIDRVLVLEAGKLSTLAGGGTETGDGGFAVNAALAKPSGVAVAQDGTVYITERDGHRIRKVLIDGRIVTAAGNGTADFTGDGGQASNAQVSSPRGIALGPDGTLYFADQGNNRIRRITTDGVISTIVGGGKYVLANGALANNVMLDEPDGLAVGPDNALYITSLDAIYRVAPGLPQLGDRDNLIPSEDGISLYRFDSKGKHLSTIDPMTGVTELTFGYDASGLPATITDKDGLVTTIKRDANGTPTSIVGPYGQVTTIELSSAGNLVGNLVKVTDPIGRAVELDWDPKTGLLGKVTDPKSKATTYAYDVAGRLTDVRDPAASAGTPTMHFEPSVTPDGLAGVIATSKEGKIAGFFSRNSPHGTWQRSVTYADGTRSDWTDDSSQPGSVSMDGTKTQQFMVPDDQFATQSMIPGATITDLPSGRRLVTVMSRVKNMSDPTSVLSLNDWTDRVEINQRGYETKFLRSTNTLTSTSPMGRTSSMTVDRLGRPVAASAPGMPTVSWTYDKDGRVAAVTKTAGSETRTEVLGYGTDGWLASRTNSLSEQASYGRDLVGRPTTVTRPDGQSMARTFDDADNVTSLIPPGRSGHDFTYDPNTKLLTLATPPAVTQSGTTLLAGQQLYTYGDDHELVSITHSDGRSVAFAYDNAGKLTTESLSKATLTFGYDSGGTLTSINRSDSVKVAMIHDGPLWIGTTWSGAIQGTVTADYDTNLWLKSLTINKASTVSFSYDNDGLLIGASSSAGGMTVARDASTGMVTATALGNIGTSNQYNGFAELSILLAMNGSSALFAQNMVRDSLGRVTHLTEYNQGASHDIWYGYDNLGRLTSAKRDGVTTTYRYDSNGNRTSSQTGSDAAYLATFDAQDRIQTYGAITYQQSAHGDLQAASDGRSALGLDYDELGNLLTATVTSQGATDTINYVVDGLGRRVARKVNGSFDRAWLYRDGLRPVSEVDSAGTFTHFVYADSAVGAPDFLIRSGVLYRVVKDHIGSVRLVVNAQSGAVAQSLEYDEFGIVLADSNPGFQPFGFAGGLYDADTTLVHFGARDYDALTGRWTNKDPIGFNGGDTNVYAYVGGDPVNLVDPDGMRPLTGKEEVFLKSVFGNSVNLSGIDVDAGVWDDAGYQMVDGDIRLPRSFFRNRNTDCGLRLSDSRIAAWFVHEVFHIWQRQRGVWVTTRGLPLTILRAARLYNPYKFRLQNSPAANLAQFKESHIEIQATMFEHGIKAMLDGDVKHLPLYWDIIEYVRAH